MKKTKVIVTGGAGFIGHHLSETLLNLGYDVHIIDNLLSGKKSNVPKKAHFYKTDIRNFEKIKPIFTDAEYVFHLAAIPSVEFSIHNPHISHDVNVVGTLNVFRASTKAGVKKVIFASSSSVYGDQSVTVLHEKLKPNPKSPYALQKWIGEEYARIFNLINGLHVVNLRFFNVYGPGQNEEGAYAFIIGKFLKYKREGKPLPITGTGTQSRDFVHVYDVVSACVNAMQKNIKPNEIINVGSGKRHTVKKIANLIGGKIEYVPARIEPKSTLAHTKKSKDILKWSPKLSLEQGIKNLLSEEKK
jgi:UDP-glucose 4-epimerase